MEAKRLSTHLSFYLNSSRIHVFIEALRGIGCPDRICFLIDRDGKRLLMLPHTKRDFISHGVPKAVYSGMDSFEISSKKLCEIIALRHGWDLSYSYRVPGVVIEDNRYAVFDLSRAEAIGKPLLSAYGRGAYPRS